MNENLYIAHKKTSTQNLACSQGGGGGEWECEGLCACVYVPCVCVSVNVLQHRVNY